MLALEIFEPVPPELDPVQLKRRQFTHLYNFGIEAGFIYSLAV